MGSLKIRLDCRVEGPIGDGRAGEASAEWARSTTQALADKGVEILGAWPMDKSGRSRGNFRSELHERRKSDTLVSVPGMRVPGVTWGPWLEGTSERNRSTKFKGYHLFEETAKQLDELAPSVAQEQLDKVLPQMGGE